MMVQGSQAVSRAHALTRKYSAPGAQASVDDLPFIFHILAIN